MTVIKNIEKKVVESVSQNVTKPIIISAGVGTISTLVKVYNLQNVKIPNAKQNQFEKSVIQSGYTQLDKTRPSELNKSDYSGIPVFADIKLVGGTYTDNISGNLVSFPDIIIDAVLVTCDFTARIIKTEIQGRDGTVKEYIGEDDAVITIQGIITGKNGVYPKTEVNSLNQWRKAPISKKAICGYLQNLGIDNLVVENFTLPQIAGGYSYQTFTMNCISDKPVELIIT